VYTNNDITSSFHTYLFLRSIPERCTLDALLRRVLYCGHSTQYSHLVVYVFLRCYALCITLCYSLCIVLFGLMTTKLNKLYYYYISSQYGELRHTDGWYQLASLWHPSKFQRVCASGLRYFRDLINSFQQRAPRSFGWAAITLGIGPYSSLFCSERLDARWFLVKSLLVMASTSVLCSFSLVLTFATWAPPYSFLQFCTL